MSDLPSPENLASMVTNVTETMWGLSFGISHQPADLPWEEEPCWRTATLPINGPRHLNVAVASDKPGGTALCSAMFMCEVGEVAPGMIDEGLSELANIVAGQVKNAMGLDDTLGLPSLAAKPAGDAQKWRAATLSNDNTSVRVWVAVTEGAA